MLTIENAPAIDAPANVRVSFGAKHLDEIRPGWAFEVDLSTLDMGDDKNCVASQIFQSCCFAHAAMENQWNRDNVLQLGIYVSWLSMASIEASYERVVREYKLLNELWRNEITHRLILRQTSRLTPLPRVTHLDDSYYVVTP